MPRAAKLYVWATAVAGLAVLVAGTMSGSSDGVLRFACYFVMANLASGFKVQLPGITGTMSANFFFVLISVTTMTLPQSLAIACTATISQCIWRAKSRPDPIKIIFNVCSVALAISATSYWYNLAWFTQHAVKPAFVLLLAACVYFIANTCPVAAIVCLTEKKPLVATWRECYFWSFPYYLVGASLAAGLGILDRLVGWEQSLLILPILYWIYRSYRLYLGRLESEKHHVEEMAGLHLRTIEALALAIEAKDFNTYDHLRRVGLYAMEIATEMAVPEPERRALQAASLLHDIGKLAVPEHIISKPGKLTAVEFEKMKIHPVIGAEILESVEFPDPVVPIVRSHHEKWDGTGYPSGLKGDVIPVGARILSVVDCFDAMTSDRQYRRAMPIEEAMNYIVSESGKSFDPKVVAILSRRHAELEALVKAKSVSRSRLSKNVRISRCSAPASGLETATAQLQAAPVSGDFLSSIAAARQEAQDLFELAHELGTSISLDETLSVLGLRLKRICPYDCIAIYVLRDHFLSPEFVSGQDFEVFASLKIPFGEGLSGWVAQEKRPIVNGNPSVEPGYLNDPTKFSLLQSALAVPLEGANGVVGVLSLYAAAHDAFTADHLRMLSAVSGKIALCVENGLKYRQAESCATTDGLTGLPNARSLFLHLDSELARAKRENHPLSVLVCDLDGFKQVNDQFGHLDGNRVLRQVAEVLRANCREYDYVARMGGDEFVILLSRSAPEDIPAKIDLFGEIARHAGLDVVGKDMLSMSVGHACYPHDGTDAEQLLAEADRRMYKMKHGPKKSFRIAAQSDLARLGDSLKISPPLPDSPHATVSGSHN
jgi:diguanylate cyclase (GGDEF)-like protein/putative nucleotidyltransferase with HDIG domain